VPDPKDAAFAAVVRPIPADRSPAAPAKILLTTADASRLVPLVLVASRGFVEGHHDAVGALARALEDGESILRTDVPATARRIAAEPGAPEPAALLERIAWIEVDAANAHGASAQMPQLFEREWRLFKEIGALTSPMPPVADVIAVVTPSSPPPARPAAASPSADSGARTLLAHRVQKGDAEAVAREIALLAGVFDRSGIRITARPAALAQAAATAASEGHSIKSDRIVVAPGSLSDTGVALIEVLAAP
jgi:hypothetical protein